MSPGELLSRFKGCRALVVGDLMLDEYLYGEATRISPEAPVMVVRQCSTRSVPGGAANVAANMVALGAKPAMVGVVGCDPAGRTLADSLDAAGISSFGLVQDPNRPTTLKTRVLAQHSLQVLRIDREDDTPVDSEIESQLLERAFSHMSECDVVLISDYQKGAVTSSMIRELVAEGRRRGVPIVANPKPRSLAYYRGAALVSLNRYEAGDALQLGRPVQDENAEARASELRDRVGVESLLVTLGGSGMAAATGAGSWRVPAVKVDLYDEAGAGDTVIATVALSLAVGAFGKEALELAAHTAGAVVQKVGVAVPSPEDLAKIA